MSDYEAMYYVLFNAITDALDAIWEQNYGRAKDILTDAQISTEEA